MTLPTDATNRKRVPIASGLIDYFPDALAAVAEVSFIGNEQHNPGTPLHWDRAKSTDEADALMRHFLERGTFDVDGSRHSAKVAWRALAMLQKELEAEQSPPIDPRRFANIIACWELDPAGDPHVMESSGRSCIACGVTRDEAHVLGHRFDDEQ